MKKETKELLATEVIWFMVTLGIYAALFAFAYIFLPSLRLSSSQEHDAFDVVEWLLYIAPICTFPVRWLINLAIWAVRVLDEKEN